LGSFARAEFAHFSAGLVDRPEVGMRSLDRLQKDES
jgi:hypothetical protein